MGENGFNEVLAVILLALLVTGIIMWMWLKNRPERLRKQRYSNFSFEIYERWSQMCDQLSGELAKHRGKIEEIFFKNHCKEVWIENLIEFLIEKVGSEDPAVKTFQKIKSLLDQEVFLRGSSRKIEKLLNEEFEKLLTD